jgi:hypothetical protein
MRVYEKAIPSHLIMGSPGITWAFFIGWFERGGKKTELLE